MNEPKRETLDNYIKTKDEAFQLIVDIGCDYDGYNTIDSLKSLIDELVHIAEIGREIQ